MNWGTQLRWGWLQENRSGWMEIMGLHWEPAEPRLQMLESQAANKQLEDLDGLGSICEGKRVVDVCGWDPSSGKECVNLKRKQSR